MRYFAQIAYKGYSYSGWQRQPTAITVQQVLEECMSKLLGTPTICIGCGRTDAMVHASQFFFHFDIDTKPNNDILFRLNKMLPDDIAIHQIIPVDNSTHAQFSATSRTYNYLIHTQKDPHLGELSAYYPQDFDLDIIKQALVAIPHHSDFVNFCRCPSRHKSTTCNVSQARLFTMDGGKMIRFQFKSNRFLQGMIRMMVQQLINVGTKLISTDEFVSYLNNSSTPRYNKSAYPQGLYLSKVEYPFMENNDFSMFSNLLNLTGWKEL
ncbi:MAG: tRNA pseudouridine(38-40) synthase TruA [Tenuifilaceae bacterium]|nr:tRNA pseudouridine(38-40) synthase TruA [Tenuifilaceae bacterium]